MLLLFQILTITVAAFAIDCPSRELVYPCSCAVEQGQAVISCEGFNSIHEIEPAVKHTIGYDVNFSILRSHLGDIPSDFFKGHKSTKLNFENCVVKSFGDTPFSGLEDSLEILYLYTILDYSHTNMDKFRLNHLKKLKYAAIGNNDLDVLGNNWLSDGPVSLDQISLVGNKFKGIGDKAFASLSNIQQLYVDSNNIKTLARSMFPNPAKMFWILGASSNEIEELPADIFEGFPKLARVNLSHNKLKSIPENVWGKIWSHLQSVFLDGNDIVCDENLKWIYKQQLPREFTGKCGPGNNLQNRDLNSLKLEDFQ
ncbi:leucine-rich repeat transmembrane neuronal protein 3-like isoform X1 [Parasteatoda tepidariorum]|uniref:leucine-rich repeat transmembrane neuronal protein 3-like isoform X1 n=1 Tax=Parasteatoda tepidariorum TaxID=114398 RepID=UPI0039BD5535